jgi:hypothetical protein
LGGLLDFTIPPIHALLVSAAIPLWIGTTVLSLILHGQP